MMITGAMTQPTVWLHVKLLLVLSLAGLQGYMMIIKKDFAADRNRRSPKFFRILNEIPPLLMILIIFLVVMKPF